MEMRYYDIEGEYPALIMAKTLERAMDIYQEDVTESIPRDELSVYVFEITKTFAAIKHSRTLGADGNLLDQHAVLSDINGTSERVLYMPKDMTE